MLVIAWSKYHHMLLVYVITEIQNGARAHMLPIFSGAQKNLKTFQKIPKKIMHVLIFRNLLFLYKVHTMSFWCEISHGGAYHTQVHAWFFSEFFEKFFKFFMLPKISGAYEPGSQNTALLYIIVFLYKILPPRLLPIWYSPASFWSKIRLRLSDRHSYEVVHCFPFHDYFELSIRIKLLLVLCLLCKTLAQLCIVVDSYKKLYL